MVTDEQLSIMSDEEFIKAAKEEFKDLPRSQRRQKERELKEHVKTMNQFTPKQLALMEEVIRYGAKAQAHEEVDKIIVSLDRCMTAYLYLKFEDYLEEDILREQDIISRLLDEDNIRIRDILKECKGDTIMAKNKMDKYESEVREVVNELLDNGVKQNKAVEILQDKFPVLSKAMLVNGFKKVKAERNHVKEDSDVIAAAEYIFPEIKEEKTVVKEDKQEIQKELKEELKKESDVITPIEEEKPVQVKSKLRRIEIREVFQGEYGEYVKTLEGVTVANKLYKDIESVDKESNDIIEKNTALIESYKASIQELNNRIDECNLTMSNVKAMSGEIKEVMLIG